MREFLKQHKKITVIIGGVIAFFLVAAIIAVAMIATMTRGGASFAPQEKIMFAGDAVRSVASSPTFAARGNIGIPETPSVLPGDISEKQVIKNATLSLVVKKIDDAVEGIRSAAENADGFIENASVYESGGNTKSGRVVVRVPADRFEETVGVIKALAIKVSREDINARDVTEQMVDLKARLDNARAEEKQYLAIMKRASKVEDVLKVTERLYQVRERIERLEGQITYLSRQVAMSTITVNLTAEADVEVFGIVWSPWAKIKEGVRSALQGIVDFINMIITFLFKLPVLILWIAFIVILLKVVWKGGIMLKNRFFIR